MQRPIKCSAHGVTWRDYIPRSQRDNLRKDDYYGDRHGKLEEYDNYYTTKTTCNNHEQYGQNNV